MIDFLGDKGVYKVTVVKNIAGKKIIKRKQLAKGSTIEDAKKREAFMMGMPSTLIERLQLCTQKEVKAPGHVYVAKNQFIPGMVKIGMTTNSVNRRLTNLSCSMPADFELVHEIFVSHPKDVEQAIHFHFAEFRVSRNREFFKITADSAIEALNQAFHVDGIDVLAALSKAFDK